MKGRLAPILFILFVALLAAFVVLWIPSVTLQKYGPPNPRLSPSQVIQYSARLLWYDGLLTQPRDSSGSEQAFNVEPGESVASIAGRLEDTGLIRDASAFRDYLIYTGLDTTLQSGNYKLKPAMSIVDIARKMQDATPADVTFVILPGWRMEEIAASLQTAGLNFTPDDFLSSASSARQGFDFLTGADSSEGFLYPDTYIVPRTVTADQFVDGLLRNFGLHLTVELREGFSRQNLTVYQAVILASIVQREAVHDEEAPMIASVYLNRLKIGMKLDADPTVQYALGFNSIQGTWWTNPLSAADLQIDSPYNTYLAGGLPPAPIDNPGLDALQAVASPADSPYFYFSARCDDSGFHQFSETFQEHLQNLCP